MEGGAYGAGKAGGAFDPHTLVRQPHTILRVVSWVRTAGWPGQAGGGVAPRARAACPSGPPPHRSPGRAAAAGGERSCGLPVPAPLSFQGPGGGGLDARGGRPLPFVGPLLPGDPSWCASPPPSPAIAVTSRPRPCSSRLGLRAAARADRRPRGRSPGFKWRFLGGGSGRGTARGGARRAGGGRSRRRGQGTRFLWLSADGVERCVGSQTPGYHPETASPSSVTLGWNPPKKCSRETRS